MAKQIYSYQLAEDHDVCQMCKSAEKNDIKFDLMVKQNLITVHHLCLILSSGLKQRAKGKQEAIDRFALKDIRKEIERASKITCAYCGLKGASIGCCTRACSTSFHLSCALEKEVLFLFKGSENLAYCERHNDIEYEIQHTDQEICFICFKNMGPFNKIKSIRLPCCKNGWIHQSCAKEKANECGNLMECIVCNSTNNFQNGLSLRGVFIADNNMPKVSKPLDMSSVAHAILNLKREYDENIKILEHEKSTLKKYIADHDTVKFQTETKDEPNTSAITISDNNDATNDNQQIQDTDDFQAAINESEDEPSISAITNSDVNDASNDNQQNQSVAKFQAPLFETEDESNTSAGTINDINGASNDNQPDLTDVHTFKVTTIYENEGRFYEKDEIFSGLGVLDPIESD